MKNIEKSCWMPKSIGDLSTDSKNIPSPPPFADLCAAARPAALAKTGMMTWTAISCLSHRPMGWFLCSDVKDGRFPKSWYPQLSSISMGLSLMNHPFLGFTENVPTVLMPLPITTAEKPIELKAVWVTLSWFKTIFSPIRIMFEAIIPNSSSHF